MDSNDESGKFLGSGLGSIYLSPDLRNDFDNEIDRLYLKRDQEVSKIEREIPEDADASVFEKAIRKCASIIMSYELVIRMLKVRQVEEYEEQLKATDRTELDSLVDFFNLRYNSNSNKIEMDRTKETEFEWLKKKVERYACNTLSKYANRYSRNDVEDVIHDGFEKAWKNQMFLKNLDDGRKVKLLKTSIKLSIIDKYTEKNADAFLRDNNSSTGVQEYAVWPSRSTSPFEVIDAKDKLIEILLRMEKRQLHKFMLSHNLEKFLARIEEERVARFKLKKSG